jgi:hypothetical protein
MSWYDRNSDERESTAASWSFPSVVAAAAAASADDAFAFLKKELGSN